MDKIWYIYLEGAREGPYSLAQLKGDSRITPDSLVWRQGFEGWIPIRDVPELEAVFNDEPQDEDETVENPLKLKSLPVQEELTLDMGAEPPYLLWIVLALLALLYVFYELYWQ